MNAVQYRFIKVLGDFDNTGCWQGDGIKSYAHWLNWKIGMNMMMGREKVRVARALPDLPLIDKEFSEGKVSYSKVRAMTHAVRIRDDGGCTFPSCTQTHYTDNPGCDQTISNTRRTVVIPASRI